MPATGRDEGSTWSVRRVRASWASVLLALLTVVAVLVARAIFMEASQPIGWVAAALTVALVISPLIDFAHRWMPRALAIIITLVIGLAVVGSVGVAAFIEIQDQLTHLRDELPAAAAELEAGQGPDGVLAQIGLESLVQDVVDQTAERIAPAPTVDDATGTVPAFFVSGVLVIFFLIWGPSMFDGLIRQISDDDRRRWFTDWALTSVAAAQRYIVAALGMALVIGLIGGGLAWWADLPTPFVLGVVLGVSSLVPYVGVLFGATPFLLLAAGSEPFSTAVALFVALVAVQAGATVVLRRWIEPRSLRVGPAVLAVTALIGSDIYGTGGALVAAVAGVVAVALIDHLGPLGPDQIEPAAQPTPAQT